MKFTSLTFASILVVGSGVDAARTIKKKNLNANMIQQKLNKANKRELLRNARVLQDNQYYNMGYSGDYSLKFSSCMSLAVLSEEDQQNNNNNNNNQDQDEQMQDMQENPVKFLLKGKTQAFKEYVVLSAENPESGDKTEYAVDLNTFVSEMIDYIPDNQESYCQACDDECANAGYYNQDSYMYNGGNGYNNQYGGDQQDGDQQDGDEQQQDANFDYDMQGGSYIQDGVKITTTDCKTCWSMGCFSEDENADDEAVNWLKEIAECSEIDGDNYDIDLDTYKQNYMQQLWANWEQDNQGLYDEDFMQQMQQDEDGDGDMEMSLYAGLACNYDGTGMTIAVYADEDCTMLAGVDFSYLLSGGGQAAEYQGMTNGLIGHMFTNYYDCMETQYMDANEYYQQMQEEQDQDQDENQDQNQQDQDQNAVNEYCASVLGDQAIDMSQSCNANYNNDANNDANNNDQNNDANNGQNRKLQNYGGEYTDMYGNT